MWTKYDVVDKNDVVDLRAQNVGFSRASVGGMKHLAEQTRKRRLDDSKAHAPSTAHVLSPPKSAKPMLGPIPGWPRLWLASASSSGAGTSSDVEVMEVEEVTAENDMPQENTECVRKRSIE